MTCGKLVAPGKSPPNVTPGPVLETPWRASDHHSYPLIPNLSIGTALFTRSLIFSWRLNLPIKSLTRSLMCNDTRQNGKLLVWPLAGSQANGGRDLHVNRRRLRTRVLVVGVSHD
ncbi:polynucleotidyl transferase [Striga asiatica]|uniref:Polynucleotidyl transferase n=1 Tax=Striga asiatica TaxID=4170 RepID=A0A5A7R3X6_STRAF|nr:polynucleotidyl transferase [Striga asiatica]